MARPRKYSDRQRFIISVLWLRGHTYEGIASISTLYGVTGMNRARVAGVIDQTPFAGRSKMPRELRQRFLAQLLADRLDGGILPDSMFEVQQ